jgi:hypothetical protein
MEDDPYLWCALHGATHCALMLREGGLKPGPPLPVACFQAGGISGQIQWRKHIAVSLREAAMLAGITHPNLSNVNFEGKHNISK